MFLGDIINASKILEDPEMMDRVEDPYVVVSPDFALFSANNTNSAVIRVMTLMHARGWETVNISFSGQFGVMMALLKNPRAKQKNVGDA
jgi:hypothetical protein